MAVVTNEKYDQFKIERLKNFLEDMAAKGQPRHYEIFVDSLKVVPKTDDVKEFDNYEKYMDETTEKIRIVIYASALSPRNDQYYFQVSRGSVEKGLSGLGEIDTIIQEKLAARDREYELKNLQTTLAETSQKLEDAEEYIEELQTQLEEAKTSKYKLKNLDLVEFGGVVLENLAKKNSPLLDKMGLGGVFNAPAQIETVPTEETQASFQKKPEDAGQLKPEYLQYIPTLQQLDATFNQGQLEIVMQILGKFSEDPTQITTVAELLNIPLSPKGE